MGESLTPNFTKLEKDPQQSHGLNGTNSFV